jgi:cytoskeletal protein CcmA (bactofilin family)
MGLFGRDERATPAPQAAGAQPSRPGTQEAPHHHGDRTVIAASILVEGTLSGSGQILVDGRVRGSIEGRDEVVVAPRGRVDATVHGRIVMVAGRVIGNITADEKIELEPTAQVDGDITAPRILIRDGATFRGKVNMKTPEPRGEIATSSARKSAAKPDQD